jgi:hypothetical protein
MKYKIVLLLLLLVSWVSVHAQLTEGDTLRFGYKFNVTGSRITGNIERLLISTSLDLSHAGKTVGLKSSTTYLYGTIFKNETENDFFSRNFIYLYPRKRLYPYAMMWLQNSVRQRIDFRYQTGVGVSYGLLHLPKQQIKISTTITHEETRYTGTDFLTEPENAEGNKIKTWRGTVRLLGHHAFADSKFKLLMETWYQTALGDSNNWRYLLSAAAEVPISSHFAFRSSLLYSYESIVLVGVEQHDSILSFGFTIKNF